MRTENKQKENHHYMIIKQKILFSEESLVFSLKGLNHAIEKSSFEATIFCSIFDRPDHKDPPLLLSK